VINSFRQNGFSDEELKQEGRLFGEIPEPTRRAIFPEELVKLNTQTRYDIGTFKADLPKIERNAVAKLRTQERIDMQNIEMQPETVENISEPSEALPTASPRSALELRYNIKAVSFSCLKPQKDYLKPKDSIYWIFGNQKNKGEVELSRVFQGVNQNETFSFSADEGLMWGENGLFQAYPNEGVVSGIASCMERDKGNVDKLRKKLRAIFGSATTILALSGVAAWIGAIVAAVGELIGWFVGWLSDDLIAMHSFTFTRKVIDENFGSIPAKKGVTQSFDIPRLFSDADGEYRLKIRVYRRTV
ncbi:MAG TPA: hypothetical protein VIQ31_01760, partial [Phormidium sp.]